MRKEDDEVEIKDQNGNILCTLSRSTVRKIMRLMKIKSKKSRIIKRTLRRFLEKELPRFF